MATPSQRPRVEVSKELAEALECSEWPETVRVIHSAGCPEEQRHWAIAELVRCAPERFVNDKIDDILGDSTEEQLDTVVPHLLKRRLWRCVSRVLQRDVSCTQHGRIIEKCIRHADDYAFLQYIFPHCSKEELGCVLAQLVSRGLWGALGKVLGRGINPEQRKWVVEQASELASGGDFAKHVLPQCRDEELEHVLPCLLLRGLWWLLDKVLARGLSTDQHRQAVGEALKRADEWSTVNYILPHCTEKELEQVLTLMASQGLWKHVDSDTHSNVSIARHVLSQMVSRGLWKAVGRFLQRDISDADHRWAIEQASRHSGDDQFVHYILPNCHDEELEHTMITRLVSQGMWGSLGKVLGRGINPTQRKWVVEQASELASGGDFAKHILPQCRDEELEHVLPCLLLRGLWWLLDKVLARGLSTDQHRQAVGEALKRADEWSTVNYILPHCTEEELEQVLTLMASQGLWKHVDSNTHSNVSIARHVLSQMVSRGLWKAVGRFLQRDISDTDLRWAVKQASRHADNVDFVVLILPQCHDEQLAHVITHLVSRGLWEAAGRVLVRGATTTDQHGWAVEQASRRAADDEFLDHILPHCHEEELERVITHLVSRGLWRSVGEVLKRGVSFERHRWAVEQASSRAGDNSFVRYILPQCHDEELEQVISRLLSQGLGWSADKIAARDTGTVQQRQDVEDALTQEQPADCMSHPSTEGALLSTHAVSGGLRKHGGSGTYSVTSITQHVLSQVASRGLWRSLGRLMQGDISSEQHGWAVEQASRHAGDDEFLENILPQCHDAELERVIAYLVSRGLWESVGKALGRNISATTHRRAVEEALKDDKCEFARCILPHCTAEEMEQVLTHILTRDLWRPEDRATHSESGIAQQVWAQIATRDLWQVVDKFLRDTDGAQHRWAVEQASRYVDDDKFVDDILPQCQDEELDHVIAHLVSRGLWKSVHHVLKKGVSATQHQWAVQEAAKQADDVSFDNYVLCHCSEDDLVAAFPLLVANRKTSCIQNIMYSMVRDILYMWMTSGHDSRAHDTLFWKFINHCRVEVSLALDLTKAVTRTRADFCHDVHEECFLASSLLAARVSWLRDLCELLMTSLLHVLCYVMCTDGGHCVESTDHTREYVSRIYTHIKESIKDIGHPRKGDASQWTRNFPRNSDNHLTDPLFLLHFLQGLHLYHVSRRGEKDDVILLEMFAVFPLFPQLQSVALRMMLREKRWDVISQACLSHVWEHDRRRLFKAAVMQRQWSVVRQWSDHTVHDDEREWVMTEAFKEKQWMAYLLLADHGLTMPEHMHAHYMVAKYAKWGTVLQMVERGGDITEVSELLENWVTGHLRKKPQSDTDAKVYLERCEDLIRLRLRFAKEAVLSPMKALERWRWGSVLFNILHEPTDDYFSRVLDKLIEEEEWHILMHLVRLGMNKAERNWLFPEMVRQQQWGVCRMLLEYGVDEQLCVEALPELMERNQWTLVARVMEYEVDDAVRRQVMQCAFHRRAGALFWHCLHVMKDKQPLIKETRVKLFFQAISRDIWQAVKPLVEEKDGPGIQRRDMAFLEAIERHLWDVVDYCQIHGADINMKDENGETPLHREARKEEWEAVKEIVLRDGKPNLLDKDGVSVLNRLIHHRQWDIVKIVLKYGGDIHLRARYSESRYLQDEIHTPLQALITARQADVIQFSIMWCGDQKKGLNDRGETCFHAVCDSDDGWYVMEDLIVRKVDPLAVTKTGKSALAYAVLNTKCPGRMVAECSKLGFSSYQPSVTGPQESLLDDIIQTVVPMFNSPTNRHCVYLRHRSVITSPLVCAVLRDSPVLVRMLYESASCSKTEVLALCEQLPELIDLNSEKGKKLYKEILRSTQSHRRRSTRADRFQPSYRRVTNIEKHTSLFPPSYKRVTNIIEKHTARLRKLVTTPRTLRSSCRLLISHLCHYSDTKRHERLEEFSIPVPLKNYLQFSDFLDPDYGSDML